MDIPSLLGEPVKLPSGREIGIINSAHTDKNGIVIHATVSDPDLRIIFGLVSHEEVEHD